MFCIDFIFFSISEKIITLKIFFFMSEREWKKMSWECFFFFMFEFFVCLFSGKNLFFHVWNLVKNNSKGGKVFQDKN